MSYMVNVSTIEIGIALENFHYKSKGKFYVPALFPTLSSSSPYINTIPSGSTANIINKPSLPISSVNMSNYVELVVPEYITTELPKVPYTNNEIIARGAQVQIMFTGGDITKPKVIGAYI